MGVIREKDQEGQGREKYHDLGQGQEIAQEKDQRESQDLRQWTSNVKKIILLQEVKETGQDL